jgi:hypothetical protein
MIENHLAMAARDFKAAGELQQAIKRAIVVDRLGERGDLPATQARWM